MATAKQRILSGGSGAITPVWQEKEIDQLSSALLPRIGEQLQNCPDADPCGQTFEPIWTDFAGDVTQPEAAKNLF